MIEQNYDLPCSVEWFQRELNSICKGRGIELRIEWCPRLYIAKTVDKNGDERNYAKYPLRFSDFQPYHVGDRFFRKVLGQQIQVGYQKRGELVPPNILPTDIAQAHIEYVNVSQHIFVIERHLPDSIAKPLHEEKRRLAKANLGFDLFKEFPKEGIWDWFGNIAAHYGVMQPSGVEESCCQIAERHQVMCEGLYREPNHQDLDEVRRALARWEAIPNVDDKDWLIEQGAKDRAREIQDWEDSRIRDLMIEAGEADKIDEIAQSRSRVVGGLNAPLNRKPY